MKELMKDLDDFDRTEGNSVLCAWQTSESTCRIQSRSPVLTKQIPKLVEVERVGTGVKGGYMAIFAVRRTLQWVKREVIEKLSLDFPKEFEGSKSENSISASNSANSLST
jgi:hypothetical protein